MTVIHRDDTEASPGPLTGVVWALLRPGVALSSLAAHRRQAQSGHAKQEGSHVT